MENDGSFLCLHLVLQADTAATLGNQLFPSDNSRCRCPISAAHDKPRCSKALLLSAVRTVSGDAHAALTDHRHFTRVVGLSLRTDTTPFLPHTPSCAAIQFNTTRLVPVSFLQGSGHHPTHPSSYLPYGIWGVCSVLRREHLAVL